MDSDLNTHVRAFNHMASSNFDIWNEQKITKFSQRIQTDSDAGSLSKTEPIDFSFLMIGSVVILIILLIRIIN